MKNLLWFLLGVIGGFVAAHLMNKDPRGHEVLADVDARIAEFTDRIGDAYREQEARISGLVDSCQDAVNDAVDAVKESASEAIDAAADASDAAIDCGAETAAKKLTD